MAKRKPDERARDAFWQYCKRAEIESRRRSKALGVPHDLTRYDIDRLLVDQQWRCSVSGILLDLPGKSRVGFREPFGPSLDRIDPAAGYVVGNVRILCTILNFAINEWGVQAFARLVRSMADNDGFRLASAADRKARARREQQANVQTQTNTQIAT